MPSLSSSLLVYFYKYNGNNNSDITNDSADQIQLIFNTFSDSQSNINNMLCTQV